MPEESSKQFVITVEQLRALAYNARESAFALVPHFNPENIVDIAKSHFPALEAEVAKHLQKEETQRITAELIFRGELERTRRLLILVAAVCLIAGATLVVFAPAGKEGVSYVVSALLGILPLGAIGVQQFRFRTIGVNIEAGEEAVKTSRSS